MSRDYERPKKSWRELDKRKDASSHRRDDSFSKNSFSKARANSASGVYKAQLDSFFNGEGKAPLHLQDKFASLQDSKEGKERKAAAAKIIGAKTSTVRDAAVHEYLKKWELPPDYNVLSEVLLCSDEELVELALDEIKKMFDLSRIPKRRALLEQRFKSLVSLSDDDDIVNKAKSILETLRKF